MQGGFSYSGQRCTAVKVVLVMEEVADELVKKVNKGVEELTVGMPEVMLFLDLLHIMLHVTLHEHASRLHLCCVCVMSYLPQHCRSDRGLFIKPFNYFGCS